MGFIDAFAKIANPIGSAISAIGGAASTALTNAQNLKMQRESQKWQTSEREASQEYNTSERLGSQEFQDQQRQAQNQYAEDIYNQYQSPLAMVEQYKAAGLNPRLAMENGNSGSISAASGSSGGAPSGSHVSPASVPPPYMQAQGYVQSFTALAQGLKSLSEAKKAGMETEYGEQQYKEAILGLKLDNEGKKLLNDLNREFLPSKMRKELVLLGQSIQNAELTGKQIEETINNLKKSGQYTQKELDSYEVRLQSLLDLQNSTKNNLDSGSRLNDSNVSVNDYRKLNLTADTALKWSQKKVSDAHVKVEDAMEALLKSQKLTEGQRRYLMRSQRLLTDKQYELFDLEHEIRAANSDSEKAAKRSEFNARAAEYERAYVRLRSQVEALSQYGVVSDLVNGVLGALDLVRGSISPFDTGKLPDD